ncbi:MAG: 2-hydroxychromene-2-carboxylate isomerase [Proteobacteria bacterium]|nr:2-hydroxychromene-2-carboxylate isomerase [Pseudomonadota bacterium]
MKRLEFFFDCSSPWTYLAFHRIEALASETAAQLEWRPILVGGVFNAVNPSVYQQRENPPPAPKARYYAKDLKDWARSYGLEIGSPAVFPVNSVKAMRGCFVALEHDCIAPYARAVFETYWGDGQDISQDEVLRAVVARVKLPESEFFERIGSPELKAKLRQNTEELIERGGFGSPTLFVGGDDMYFGNDRLPLVRAALERA